jgi:hypothetical protein
MELYRTDVKNWTDAQAIKISAQERDTPIGIPALVTLTQSVSSVHFQFSMSPDVAREMAKKLIFAADQIDFHAKRDAARIELIAGLEETEAARAE